MKKSSDPSDLVLGTVTESDEADKGQYSQYKHSADNDEEEEDLF